MNLDLPLIPAVRIQARVTWALMLREIVTRYGRGNLGFFWLFLEPMMFTSLVSLLWSTVGMSHVSSLPIVAFAITGYSSVLLWRNCASRCAMSVAQNMPLLYHRNVKILDIFFARILLEMVGASCSFTVLSWIGIAVGLMDFPIDILKVLFAWLMLFWFGAALAIIGGALTAYSEIAERFWHPVSYILFPLSGAVFMVDWLSPELQQLVMFNPIVHGVELLREGYFGSVVRTYHDIGHMAGICLAMTLIGLAMTRNAERHLEILV